MAAGDPHQDGRAAWRDRRRHALASDIEATLRTALAVRWSTVDVRPGATGEYRATVVAPEAGLTLVRVDRSDLDALRALQVLAHDLRRALADGGRADSDPDPACLTG